MAVVNGPNCGASRESWAAQLFDKYSERGEILLASVCVYAACSA